MVIRLMAHLHQKHPGKDLTFSFRYQLEHIFGPSHNMNQLFLSFLSLLDINPGTGNYGWLEKLMLPPRPVVLLYNNTA